MCVRVFLEIVSLYSVFRLAKRFQDSWLQHSRCKNQVQAKKEIENTNEWTDAHEKNGIAKSHYAYEISRCLQDENIFCIMCGYSVLFFTRRHSLLNKERVLRCIKNILLEEKWNILQQKLQRNYFLGSCHMVFKASNRKLVFYHGNTAHKLQNSHPQHQLFKWARKWEILQMRHHFFKANLTWI